MPLPSAPVKTLGKEEISKKKNQKSSLPSALFLALGKDLLYRVPCPGAQQSLFFCLQIFCAALLKYQELVRIWGFFWLFKYLVTLFRLLEFF